MRGRYELREWELDLWKWRIKKDLSYAIANPGVSLNYTTEDITPRQFIILIDSLGWYEISCEFSRGNCYLILINDEGIRLYIYLDVFDMTFNWGCCEE